MAPQPSFLFFECDGMIRVGLFREFGIANLGLSLVWCVVVISGIKVLLDYEMRPGNNPCQLGHWPEDSAIQRSASQPTVVMFTHPHCPCTRSSISEFNQVVSNCRKTAEFKVVAFDPLDSNRQWRKSDLVESAIAIRGVVAHWDKNGREAARFNVKTSGHVVLYDGDGHLRFSGGITGSRGHEGSNLGRSRLISWLRMSPEKRASQTGLLESPVFGCALVDGSEAIENE